MIMKRFILTFFFIFMCSGVFSQTGYDSLKQKILKMDIAINNIHKNMVSSHNEFRAGTIFIVAGILISSFVFVQKDTSSYSTYLYIGAGLTAIGGVLQIDSHKYFWRGGRRLTTKY
jgi:UDP-N-acetylmuramyl pentapeptide phosphotransferase/UDP-N-acetylglucosamine-1-phosphate transferase